MSSRVARSASDNPFQAARREVERLKKETNVVVVDMHCEATSEKIAMGWWLDGHASFVFGTHTHIPTADERVLPKGTAYITDVGMTGPHDSVIGVEKDAIIRRFLTQMPQRFVAANADPQINAAVVTIDSQSGRCEHIEALQVADS